MNTIPEYLAGLLGEREKLIEKHNDVEKQIRELNDKIEVYEQERCDKYFSDICQVILKHFDVQEDSLNELQNDLEEGGYGYKAVKENHMEFTHWFRDQVGKAMSVKTKVSKDRVRVKMEETEGASVYVDFDFMEDMKAVFAQDHSVVPS